MKCCSAKDKLLKEEFEKLLEDPKVKKDNLMKFLSIAGSSIADKVIDFAEVTEQFSKTLRKRAWSSENILKLDECEKLGINFMNKTTQISKDVIKRELSKVNDNGLCIKERMSHRLEVHFSDLTKLSEISENDPVTMWLEFFKDPGSKEAEIICEHSPEIKEARDKFEKLKADPQYIRLIEMRKDAQIEFNSAIAYAIEEAQKKAKAEAAAEKKD